MKPCGPKMDPQGGEHKINLPQGMPKPSGLGTPPQSFKFTIQAAAPLATSSAALCISAHRPDRRAPSLPKALRAARQPLDQHEHWVSPPVPAAFAAAWSAVCPRSTPTRRSQSGGVTSARNRMTCSLSDQHMRAVPRMSARAAGMHALTTPRPREYRIATHIRACGGGVGSNFVAKARAAAHAGGYPRCLLVAGLRPENPFWRLKA